MIIDRLSRRDFANKLRGAVVVGRYNRHSTGRRLGIAMDPVRGNTAKIKVKWWDYKLGLFSSRTSPVLLSKLDILIPQVGYFGNTYYKQGAYQHNRYSYGLSFIRLRDDLTDHQILQVYGIYPREQNSSLIPNKERRGVLL